MIIGILKLKLFLRDSNSLKDKRMVLRSLKDKVRQSFNVSISELDDHDKWQRSTIGIAAIGMDKSSINSLLDKVVNFVESLASAEIADHEIEII